MVNNGWIVIYNGSPLYFPPKSSKSGSGPDRPRIIVKLRHKSHRHWPVKTMGNCCNRMVLPSYVCWCLGPHLKIIVSTIHIHTLWFSYRCWHQLGWRTFFPILNGSIKYLSMDRWPSPSMGFNRNKTTSFEHCTHVLPVKLSIDIKNGIVPKGTCVIWKLFRFFQDSRSGINERGSVATSKLDRKAENPWD